VASGLLGLKADFRTVWARSTGRPDDMEVTGIACIRICESPGDAHRAQQESETLPTKSAAERRATIERAHRNAGAIDERVFAATSGRRASTSPSLKLPPARGHARTRRRRQDVARMRLTLWGVPFALTDYLVDPNGGNSSAYTRSLSCA